MTDKICCNCQYYDGVKGTPGHAPCELKNSMTTWSKTCESICLIPLRLLIGTTDEPETNGDRIRAMTDEELAQFMENRIPFQVYVILGEDRYSSWIDWMQQEAE